MLPPCARARSNQPGRAYVSREKLRKVSAGLPPSSSAQVRPLLSNRAPQPRAPPAHRNQPPPIQVLRPGKPPNHRRLVPVATGTVTAFRRQPETAMTMMQRAIREMRSMPTSMATMKIAMTLPMLLAPTAGYNKATATLTVTALLTLASAMALFAVPTATIRAPMSTCTLQSCPIAVTMTATASSMITLKAGGILLTGNSGYQTWNTCQT